MNGEWMLQVVTVLIPILVSVIVSAIVGYLLGSKRQKKQILREHITRIVKDEYRPLFDEMRRNTELLDNYLKKPFVHFSFPKLATIYNEGLDEFVKNHHRNLFLVVDSFRKNILPEFNNLHSLKKESVKKISDIWSSYLRKSLPEADSPKTDIFIRIAADLLTTINPYNVLPLLLNGRDKEVRSKVEACILARTSHIYQKKAKRPFVIRGQAKVINYNEISQALIDKAKPEVAKIVDKHKELKKQNDNEVKEKLLPLLKKYVSNPI